MDSQSGRTTENRGVQGYDAGKKIKRRKRSAMVDTDGRALRFHVHAADIQNRDNAGPPLRASRSNRPFMEPAFADSAYRKPRIAAASPLHVEIMRNLPKQIVPVAHARNWMAKRLFARTNRNRRSAKHMAATLASAQAFLYAASAILLLRRLAR